MLHLSFSPSFALQLLLDEFEVTSSGRRVPVVFPLGPRPEPDETISSWIGRGAALHGLRVEDVHHFAREQTARQGAFPCADPFPVRNFPDFLTPLDRLRALELAAGLAEGSIKRLSRSKLVFHHARKTSYCPLCFESDLQREVLPYRRASWSLAALTGCSVHECPLFDWHVCDDRGNWIYPPEWCDYVSKVDIKTPGFIREEDPARCRQMPEFFLAIYPKLRSLEYDAYDFFPRDVRHARQLSRVLSPEAVPDAAITIDPVIWEEWRAELLFELELARLRRSRDSVLRLLGPGNWQEFASDLYSILTTRFLVDWTRPARERGLAWITDLAAGAGELFAKWPRERGFYHAGEFKPSLWNWPPATPARRFALNCIRCGLEDFFGWPVPKAKCKAFPGYIEDPEIIHYYYNYTSLIHKNFGHELITEGCSLDGPQESDWFRQRLQNWPSAVKSYVESEMQKRRT